VEGVPGRALGLDLGTRRIGVALSDSARTLATPYEILERTGDAARDRSLIAAMVRDAGATVLVVGLPLSLNGQLGAAAQDALAEVRELEHLLDIPVETVDERLTTVEVERRQSERGAEAGRDRRGGRGARRAAAHGSAPRRRRASVDDAAAALLLQTWLDTDRHRSAAESRPGQFSP